jgi:hypothetical protein
MLVPFEEAEPTLSSAVQTVKSSIDNLCRQISCAPNSTSTMLQDITTKLEQPLDTAESSAPKEFQAREQGYLTASQQLSAEIEKARQQQATYLQTQQTILEQRYAFTIHVHASLQLNVEPIYNAIMQGKTDRVALEYIRNIKRQLVKWEYDAYIQHPRGSIEAAKQAFIQSERQRLSPPIPHPLAEPQTPGHAALQPGSGTMPASYTAAASAPRVRSASTSVASMQHATQRQRRTALLEVLTDPWLNFGLAIALTASVLLMIVGIALLTAPFWLPSLPVALPVGFATAPIWIPMVSGIGTGVMGLLFGSTAVQGWRFVLEDTELEHQHRPILPGTIDTRSSSRKEPKPAAEMHPMPTSTADVPNSPGLPTSSISSHCGWVSGARSPASSLPQAAFSGTQGVFSSQPDPVFGSVSSSTQSARYNIPDFG